MAQNLTRRDRRAMISKAAKLYGIKGEPSVDLHEAYRALAREEIPRALSLAHPVSQTHPGNKHPWIILGGAALAQREGSTAAAFFGQAEGLAPRDSTVLTGLAKAHVLNAEVEEAVATAERAFAAGSEDTGLIGIYLDLMTRLGRRQRAAGFLAPLVRKSDDADLAFKLGNLLTDAEEPGRAVEFLNQAHRLDPTPEAHRIGQLRARVYAADLEAAEPLARFLLSEVADRDAVMVLLLMTLRVLGRLDEVLALAEAHDFDSPEAFAHSRGIVANALQDLGRYDEAEEAYVEGIHITGGAAGVAKAYGVYLYRAGRFEEGERHFAERMPAIQRRYIAFDHAAPENMGALPRLHLMAEQGIGDQLALLPLLRLAPVDHAELVFVGDHRFGPALEGNGLRLRHVPMDEFTGAPQHLSPTEMVYLGDLSRYLRESDPARRHGAYLTPNAERVASLRAAYRSRADGRPITGMAWRSNSLIGRLRSIPLAEMVATLPRDALVVSLQYGDVRSDIAAAREVRPDVEILCDPKVDQMRDLAGFLAQIAALDRVVTIDNTTAHACGALAHPEAHLLLPGGSECMWYWGTEGQADPWYGALRLHRQSVTGSWSAPLGSVRDTLAA